MEDIQTQDVDQAELNTAPDSSSEEQTATETNEPEVEESTSSVEESEEQKVPYSRFKEVNDKAKKVEELEARLKEYESKNQTPANPQQEQIKEALKQLGFVSKEELEAEKQKLEQDRALDQKLTRLESTYSGKDGRPKFSRQEVIDYCLDNGISDPEAGYKLMNEKALLDWHIKNASGKTQGVKSEASDGSSKKDVGTSDDDLKQAIAKGDQNALKTLMRRSFPSLNK